jgi:hypothetical protein
VKKADITPGVVYAYQESKYRPIEQIKFLGPLSELYTNSSGYSHKRGPIRLDEQAKKPSRSYSGLTGYLVAIGDDVTDASKVAALTGGNGGLSYQYRIIIQTTKVIGVYDDVKAQHEAETKANREAHDAATAENNRLSEELWQLVSRLEEHGLSTILVNRQGLSWINNQYNRDNSPPKFIGLTLEQATTLTEYIESLLEAM